jgi:hypothetical protein
MSQITPNPRITRITIARSDINFSMDKHRTNLRQPNDTINYSWKKVCVSHTLEGGSSMEHSETPLDAKPESREN